MTLIHNSSFYVSEFTVSGLELSHFGSFHLSISQTLKYNLKNVHFKVFLWLEASYLIQLTNKLWSVDSSAPLFTRVSKIYGDYTIQLQNQRLGYLVLGPLMDTFMLRLGAHYGPTVVSTEVQEQNLTWVQTGHTVLPNQTIQV